jgi:flagellar biosynthesis GTPase FlhF
MSRRDNHQRPRPGHGYDPRAAAAAQWYGAAAASFPDLGAPPLHGLNPFGFAPNPLFANPFNAMVSDLLFQNPAAIASYQQQLQQQQQQQQQQAHRFPSQAYHQTPTSNTQRRPTKPAASASASPAQAAPQPQQQQPLLPQRQQAVIDRAQAAARKAREELVKSGEGVTGWKVAQAVLVALKVDSWASLGVQLQDVPLLRDLFLIEGKVSTYL